MSRRQSSDDPLDGGEWLLEALNERSFRPPSGEIETRRGAHRLVRWGEIESEGTVNQLATRQCSICGRPARSAIYDLHSRRRTVLCGSCRPREGERA